MISYDPHQWWQHFFDVKGSLLKEILGRVAGVTIWAVIVTYADHRTGDVLEIPLAVHSIVGGALGLLLVFRTNSAYDRFWEGRKLWGAIVNESRNLVRASKMFISDRTTIDRLTRLNIAFTHAVMHSLRGKKVLGEGARYVSDPAQLEACDHIPLECARRISQTLRGAGLSDYQFVYVDSNVQQLIDYMGGCERIRKTPLPFAYLVHLRRALMIYCASLPFALIHEFGLLTVPVTLVVSFIFFGIEEIGVEIEDPFGTDDNDLPLEEICATIERNLLALAAARE
jgi:putative membrane protein